MSSADKTKLDGLTAVVQRLFAQTATVTVGLGSTAEAVITGSGIGTVTLPANFFTVGKSIRISADGTMNRSAGNVTIRIRIGGVGGTIILATAAHNPGSGLWHLPPTTITCRATGGAGVGSVISNSYLVEALSFIGFGAGNPNPVNIDTTVTQNVVITAQWTSTNASNAYTCTNLVIESIP